MEEEATKNSKFQEYGVNWCTWKFNEILWIITSLKFWKNKIKLKKFTIIEINLAVKPLLSPLDLGLNPARPNPLFRLS